MQTVSRRYGSVDAPLDEFVVKSSHRKYRTCEASGRCAQCAGDCSVYRGEQSGSRIPHSGKVFLLYVFADAPLACYNERMSCHILRI